MPAAAEEAAASGVAFRAGEESPSTGVVNSATESGLYGPGQGTGGPASKNLGGAVKMCSAARASTGGLSACR